MAFSTCLNVANAIHYTVPGPLELSSARPLAFFVLSRLRLLYSLYDIWPGRIL